MFKMGGLYNNAGQQEMLVWAQVCIFAFVKEMEENLYLVYNKWIFGRVSSGVKRPCEYLAASGTCWQENPRNVKQPDQLAGTSSN